MGKKDKFFDRMKPPGGRSPYEMGMGGKIMKPMEQKKEACDTVQGCGDPGCPICLPKDAGRGGGGKPNTDDKRGSVPTADPGASGGGRGGASGPEYVTFDLEASPFGSTFAELLFGSGRGGKSEMVRAMMEQMKRMGDVNFVLVGPGGVEIGGGGQQADRLVRIKVEKSRDETPEAKAAREAEAKRAAAKAAAMQAEKGLRRKVEDYFLETAHSLSWDDVVGNDKAKLALVEAIEYPVKHAALFKFYGKRIGKGVLLSGPPGCGKTMFAKAAASRMLALHGGQDNGAPCAMLVINGPSIQSPYVGVTEGIIRDIFEYARAFKAAFGYPLVVFIDEADAILPSRDGTGGRRALPWEESNVATFLTEMDGMEESGAFVIIATNRPHMIDEALLRDGRCDRKITVERPTQAAAETIVFKAMKNVPLNGLEIVVTEDGELDPAGVAFAQDLAKRVVASFWEDWRALSALRTNKGTDYLRLRDIVNGAMLVGLVEKAKGFAFERDLKADTMTGIGLADFEAAIKMITEDNTAMTHTAAIEEYIERTGVTELAVHQLQKPALTELDA